MTTMRSAAYEPFSISVIPDRQEVAVIPKGELDMSCVDALDREVRELRAAGFSEIVLDLRKVSFLDSTGLRLLLSLRSDAERDGHDLTLVRGPRAVQRIFELTATRGLFDWREA